jgi:2-polyprenyl-3-methyl-5-hydroxy-6-metoxy-1,4-benzoquinol methylase
MPDKFEIQDNLYRFPYHYIPHFDEQEIPFIHRELIWGWDYLTYMHYTLDYITQNILQNQKIIDIGCGDGYLLNNLRIEGVKKFGIDLSEKAIKFAEAFNTDTIFNNQSVYDINEQFDLVVLNEVIEHIPDNEIYQFMDQIKRIVNRNGKIIITVPSIDIPLNQKHYRHYTIDQIVKELNDSRFQMVHSKKLFIQSRKLKRIQWLLNNRFYLIKNRSLIKKFWEWHKKNTYETDNKKAHHIFSVFLRTE